MKAAGAIHYPREWNSGKGEVSAILVPRRRLVTVSAISGLLLKAPFLSLVL
jgi:hypothetical protein